jgi:hypothetical protein
MKPLRRQVKIERPKEGKGHSRRNLEARQGIRQAEGEIHCSYQNSIELKILTAR